MPDDQDAFVALGESRVLLLPDFSIEALKPILSDLAQIVQGEQVEVLQAGRHRTVLFRNAMGPALVIKAFGRQHRLKDHISNAVGSKALRTFRHARFLFEKGVGTPRPVAVVERWHAGSLAESYYVSVYVGGLTSFRDALIRLFREEPSCTRFMSLLNHVAVAIAEMHDAGFVHKDLGNQNIMLSPPADGQGRGDVFFVDLNRGRIRDQGVSLAERGADCSRLTLPGDFLRVFLEMYWRGRVPPLPFLKAQARSRRRFAWHTATRAIRHPFRETRLRRNVRQHNDYPVPRDLWVWDEKSVQAVSTMTARERHRHYPWSRIFYYLRGACMVWLPAAVRVRPIRAMTFARSGDQTIGESVGVAMMAQTACFEGERAWLRALGAQHVWIRVYHHESAARTAFRLSCVERLVGDGYRISVALVQDRQAVRYPDVWEAWCKNVLRRVADKVMYVEYLHAVNRVKWGLWGFESLRKLFDVLGNLQSEFSRVAFIGPSVIDFEEEYLAAAMALLPRNVHFSALSQHLYVDRRGAPEQTQRGYDLVGKLSVLKAFAERSGQCDAKVVVSEFNWPIAGTGAYSPVTSPYESPGVRHNDPSVSEATYARFVLRYLLLAIGSGLVELAVVWRLVARGFGLVDDTEPDAWRPRPAFTALAVLLKQFGDYRFEKRWAQSEENKGCVFLGFTDDAGSRMCAAWCLEAPRDATLPFVWQGGIDMLGSPFEGSGQHYRLGADPVYFFLK